MSGQIGHRLAWLAVAVALVALGPSVGARASTTNTTGVSCAAPANGTHMVESTRHGMGELTVTNGYGSAVLVQLTLKGRTEIAVFVRKKSTFAIKGIPDGSYTLYYRAGTCWDDALPGFAHTLISKRFEDPLPFATKTTASGTTWTTWTIRLNSGGGTTGARTSDVTPPPLR